MTLPTKSFKVDYTSFDILLDLQAILQRQHHKKVSLTKTLHVALQAILKTNLQLDLQDYNTTDHNTSITTDIIPDQDTTDPRINQTSDHQTSIQTNPIQSNNPQTTPLQPDQPPIPDQSQQTSRYNNPQTTPLQNQSQNPLQTAIPQDTIQSNPQDTTLCTDNTQSKNPPDQSFKDIEDMLPDHDIPLQNADRETVLPDVQKKEDKFYSLDD